MNIGIFTDTFPPEINGVATSSYNLANALNSHGHNVFVICTNPYSKKLIYSNRTLRIPGLELKKIYSYRIANIYNSQAMKIISNMNLDLIHVQTEASIGLLGRIAAKKSKIPLVYTYHTMYEDYTYYVTKGNGFFDHFAKKIVRYLSRNLAENTTEFISPSIKTKDIMRDYGVDSYINIVPTGIDFSKYKKENIDNEKLNNLRKQYSLDDNYVILSLGRVAKEKSIDICIKGFKHLIDEKNIKVKFLIVGDGPELNELKKLVHDMELDKYVIFAGSVMANEVPLYYRLANLFVSASITETQGLTFMEAMASSIPILARFDENLVDVVTDNETGFYFSDELDFAKQIKKIMKLDNKQKEKILINAMNICNQYSLDKFYDNIMEVYTRALRKYW